MLSKRRNAKTRVAASALHEIIGRWMALPAASRCASRGPRQPVDRVAVGCEDGACFRPASTPRRAGRFSRSISSSMDARERALTALGVPLCSSGNEGQAPRAGDNAPPREVSALRSLSAFRVCFPDVRRFPPPTMPGVDGACVVHAVLRLERFITSPRATIRLARHIGRAVTQRTVSIGSFSCISSTIATLLLRL